MMFDFGLGLAVGLILALTGAGGGILAVPFLVLGAKLRLAEAAPIGLIAVGLAAALGALMGLRAGTVRYKAALLIASCGIFCSPFGLRLARGLPNRPLALGFSALLLYVALRVYRQAGERHTSAAVRGAAPCRIDAVSARLLWTFSCARALALTGALAGLLSGLLGVGGGFVIVPALRRYSELSATAILSTSLAVIALVSLSAVAASAVGGHVNWSVGLPFAAGALGGMALGQPLAARLAGAVLQKCFAGCAALVALTMAFKAGW